MIVRCKRFAWTPEDVVHFGGNPLFTPVFSLTVGRDYLVLGMQFIRKSTIYGAVTLFELENDDGVLVPAPNVLFQVVDGRASKWWEARQDEDGDLKLCPREFYQEYFHDDLSNRNSGALTAFREVRERLIREFARDDELDRGTDNREIGGQGRVALI